MMDVGRLCFAKFKGKTKSLSLREIFCRNICQDGRTRNAVPKFPIFFAFLVDIDELGVGIYKQFIGFNYSYSTYIGMCYVRCGINKKFHKGLTGA